MMISDGDNAGCWMQLAWAIGAKVREYLGYNDE
jgi:hypothetical protein